MKVRETGAFDPLPYQALRPEQLADVRYQYGPVDLKGVIRDAGVEGVGRLYLILRLGDQTVETRVLTYKVGAVPEDLIDGEVEIKGVLEAYLDMNGTPSSLHLFVNALSDVVTTRSAPPASQVPPETVLSISSGRTRSWQHRVRLSGTVSGDVVGTRAKLTDGTGTVDVVAALGEEVELGRTEVIGFVDRTPTVPFLASARKAN